MRNTFTIAGKNQQKDLDVAKIQQLAKLCCGVKRPVKRGVYAVVGFTLMLLKYVVEACLIWTFTKNVFTPLDFLNPLLSRRAELVAPGPEWLPWALVIWTLPFLWIAITMSVRRAADAGRTPWSGLVILLPLVNLVFMLSFCVLPTKPGDHWSYEERASRREHQAKSAAIAVGLSLFIGSLMGLLSVMIFRGYGASLFMGTPLLMGTSAAFFFNQDLPRSYGASVGVGVASMFFGACAMMLFALEGLFCIMMAVPTMVPIGMLGGVIGKAIADATRRPTNELFAAILVLPILAGMETLVFHSAEHVVLTSVEIDAPPEIVWDHVISFPDLSEPDAWYFKLGISYPQRACIEGTGVGATRYCEFTTGTFVEPITVWKPGKRLAFDVTDQPAPMIELSPYHHVHAPHLEGSLKSRRGEFLLIELPGGRTKLEGRTWYTFEMYPQLYWTIWSNMFIHRIHERVLDHIKNLSEQENRGVGF